LTVVSDPELGPAVCSRCGRAIVWALTDKDVRVPVEQVDPWDITRGSWWVCGLEGPEGEEVIRARVVLERPGSGAQRWAIHFPGGHGCPEQEPRRRPLLGVLPGGKVGRA